jgi:hypothetical protein
MVDEVNRHLPQEERLSPLGWYGGKYTRVLREYSRLYPAGKRVGQLRWSVVLGMLFTAGAGVALGLEPLLMVLCAGVGCVATWLWIGRFRQA